VANRHDVLKICCFTEEDEGLAKQWEEEGFPIKQLCTINKRKCGVGTAYENVLLLVLVFCMTMIVTTIFMGIESEHGVACVCLKNGPNDPSLPSPDARRSWFQPPSSEGGASGRALLADRKTQHVQACAKKYPENTAMTEENAKCIDDSDCSSDVCDNNAILWAFVASVATQLYKILLCYPCMQSGFGVTTQEEETECGWSLIGLMCEPGRGIACCCSHFGAVMIVAFSIFGVFETAGNNPNMSPAAPVVEAIIALALNFGIYTPVYLTCLYYYQASKTGVAPQQMSE
jgi:hypothetical protein